MNIAFGAPEYVKQWVKDNYHPVSPLYTADKARTGKWTVNYSEYRYGIDPEHPESPDITPRQVICMPSQYGWSGEGLGWRQPDGKDTWEEVRVIWFIEIYPDNTNGIGMGIGGYQYQVQDIDFAKEIAEAGENTFFREPQPSQNGTCGLAWPTGTTYTWSQY